MKEQIEEKHALSESIYMSGHGLDWKDSDDIAEQLYTEGYRKHSDVIDEFAKRLKEKLDISVFGVSSEEVAYYVELTIDGIVEEMKGGAE